MKEAGKNLLLLSLSLIAGLLLVEAGLRLAGYNHSNVIGDGEEGIGWKYLPNQSVVTNHFFDRPTRITINSLGFRGREIGPKRDGVRRVLMLGDSTTLGYGVSDDETVPYYLETMLNESGYPSEIINGGIGGTTIFHQKGVYKKYGGVIKPDEVLLLFFLNDIHGIEEYYKVPLPPQHSEGVRFVKKVFYNTAIGDLVIRLRTRLVNRELAFFPSVSAANAGPRENFDKWMEEFEVLARLVSGDGIPLTLVALPFGPKDDDYRQDEWSVKSFASEFKKRNSAGVNVPVFALFEKFPREEAERQKLVLPDWHYTAEGNRIIAGLLKDYMIARGEED